MGNALKLLVVGLLAVAVGAVIFAKRSSEPSAGAAAAQPAQAPLPRLVDLGADKCIPCKQMAPILEELKQEQAGKLHVEFIDVWKTPGASEKYAVFIIPTQIFYDADGQELFRHEGFMSKEDILATCQRLGFELNATPGL